MRISNSLLYQHLQSDLSGALAKAYDAQQQLTTGRKFQQAADDPLSAVEVVRAQQGLRAVEQYRRNSQGFRTKLDTEESAVTQVLDLLDDARATGLAEGSANASTATRRGAALDVQSVLDQVVALGNSKVGDEYIFAGNQVGAPPFALVAGAVVYAGDTGVRQAEVNDGQLITVNHDGSQLLMSSGVATALQNLRDALNADNEAGIQAATDQVRTAFDTVQSVLGEVGARSKALDNVGVTHDALETVLTGRENRAWNVDAEKATVSLASAQATLQAALLAATKVINTNLTQYL